MFFSVKNFYLLKISTCEKFILFLEISTLTVNCSLLDGVGSWKMQ